MYQPNQNPNICTKCRSLICLKLTVRQPVLSQAVRWAAWVIGQLTMGPRDDSTILENGTWKHVGAKPHVRPHLTKTPKQYRTLVIRGGIKHWLYAGILTVVFRDLGYRV